MPNVKILKDTVANNKQVKRGEVIDVSDADARLLIALKKAKAADTKPKTETATTKAAQ